MRTNLRSSNSTHIWIHVLGQSLTLAKEQFTTQGVLFDEAGKEKRVSSDSIMEIFYLLVQFVAFVTILCHQPLSQSLTSVPVTGDLRTGSRSMGRHLGFLGNHRSCSKFLRSPRNASCLGVFRIGVMVSQFGDSTMMNHRQQCRPNEELRFPLIDIP